ncbi:hypothetical protein [Pseudorhodoferax sp.]|uniref:hypothetical protein n=1 Tax=Pseudorhodoferax sp. TaxID=1993553 RepID=UPI002DD68409|nr:hypothetical protein [Pseudorhodoferax sp.]
MPTGTQALTIAALLSATAALAHLACIALGPPAYRLMGAGERMARAAAAGNPRATRVTLAISAMLLLWAAYALSGAGIVGALPLTRPALVLISAVYLARALAFPWLKPVFPENSDTFWWVSSGICACIGLVHAYGTFAMWHTL